MNIKNTFLLALAMLTFASTLVCAEASSNSSEGLTPLMIACQNTDRVSIQKLLKSGNAEVNKVSGDNKTALNYLVESIRFIHETECFILLTSADAKTFHELSVEKAQ